MFFVLFLQGRTLQSHDYVFWCGDFNYRIDMDKEEVKQCVVDGDYETLKPCDQLLQQRKEGQVNKNH